MPLFISPVKPAIIDIKALHPIDITSGISAFRLTVNLCDQNVLFQRNISKQIVL